MRAFRDLIIFDPAAAGADRDEVRQVLSDALPDATFRGIVGDEDIEPDIDRAIKSGYDRIIAAGGDDTIAAVASGMLYSGLPLGILPLGPKNLTALAMGLALDPVEACELLTGAGGVREADAMTVNGELSLAPVVIGLRRLAFPEPNRGFFSRLSSGRAWRFRIRLDGATHKIRASCLVIGNAEKRDRAGGRLRLAVFRKVSIAARLWAIGGESARQSDQIKATREIRIECSSPFPLYRNSEQLHSKSVAIENLPGAVRVIGPRGL